MYRSAFHRRTSSNDVAIYYDIARLRGRSLVVVDVPWIERLDDIVDFRAFAVGEDTFYQTLESMYRAFTMIEP